MNTTIKNFFYRSRNASIIPITVILIGALIPLTGLAVDVSYYGILRSSVEKASEAASVAGAQEYFRSRADAGRAVNTTVRVFKMNISEDTMAGNYYNPTGPGNPTTLSYTKTFTVNDGLSALYRGSSVLVTVMADANRGKISVTSELTPNPFFAKGFANAAKIAITKTAELPPYDVVFVVDLSGSMRFNTLKTFVGSGQRRRVGVGAYVSFTDIIFSQGENQASPLKGSNGYEFKNLILTDIILNSPGVDIPGEATYVNSTKMYTSDPKRGYIVNTKTSGTSTRYNLSGLRINELAGSNIANEDKQLAQSYANLRELVDQTKFNNYFNRAAGYIEPCSSAVYGIKSFIDTMRTYGTAALKIALVTFSTNSYSNERINSETNDFILANTAYKRMNNIIPYIALVSSGDFSTIVDKLTIMTSGGNGSANSPLKINSFPNGGTNINAGLDNAKTTLDKSDRPKSEKIIILFTDGEPSHSFESLGTKVKSLTDVGVKIYSVVLTLAISQDTIDKFRNAMEQLGKAEPVIFISDPARLEAAFIQIADELGLKLVN